MKRKPERKCCVETETEGARAGTAEWISPFPGDVLELHPSVRELQRALQVRDAALADKDREIARLRVALAFGIKDLPARRPPA